MTPFRNQPLARKALLLGLVPALCAMAIATAAFLVSTYAAARRNVLQDIQGSAAILADSVNGALGFNDPKTAFDMARALREKQNIQAACVFDAQGSLFTAYDAPGVICPKTLAGITPPGPARVAVMQPVMVGQRQIGTVRVLGSLRDIYVRLLIQAIVAALAIAAGTLLAVMLIRRMRGTITGPIGALASTADQVSLTGDYALRAEQTTTDEVGRLVRSFNDMLGRIEAAERERAELLRREREMSRLKDEFLATVSHELRTPLNAILGWTHILKLRTPDSDTLRRGLDSLDRNARAQTRLIEDLIEVSRIATGKLNLRLDVVDLRDVVRLALDAIASAAAAKPVNLRPSLPERPALVTGDRDRLLQVVSNLLGNALKFTPAGGTISVSLRHDGREFVLVVTDTGIGIAAEFLPHVFERFRQADGSTTREFGGLGLGLSIVAEIVNLHNGTVTASSGGQGKGATFTIRLPQLVDVDAPSEDEPASADERTRLDGLTVLIVDDNLDALEVAAIALSSAGAIVRRSPSGADAVESWRRQPADVLVCDIGMPTVDGFEVLRDIQALDTAHGRRTTAIALTAYASPTDVERTRQAGFVAHVTKPLVASTLLEAVADGYGMAGAGDGSQ